MTALFCDLVGFTPLSEQLDPEEVRDIQDAYFTAMREQIERYGGTVEKYAGDAVLAFFGAPFVREDDAERAVLCALAMQRAIQGIAGDVQQRHQVEPAIRVGVNTGEVVSGLREVGSRVDLDITGDAVNTAARFQAAADPGEVLVGAETMRLTRRRIHFGPKRDLVLKGKIGSVAAYTAAAIREDFGERWEETPRVSPLVGRDRELVHLFDAWIRVQGGEGQLVTVVGEPGVGKSRLVAEMVEKVSSAGAVRVIRGRCLSYGQEISLWLVADLLRSLFGIREQDGQAEVQVKVEAALRSLLSEADTASRAEAHDVLGEVLGLSPGASVVAQAGPQIRRQALLRSLRLLVGVLSERSPTVLVLEDLHWIDEASQEVLREVLSDAPGLRLLVLAAHRPGWTAPWSEWGWTERLTLRPLGEADAAVLAGAVLGGMQLSPELGRYVAERAGGNPFFVEEMLRALDESGGLVQRDGVMGLAPGAAERLPSTLTEVLLARLDRLEGQVRNVAQVASVIGRIFAVRLLAQVMDREQAALELPLVALQQAEIAFPRRGVDLEYIFKHVSMREVAYNTLVTKRRHELHLQTARAIASLYPADEYVELIAYHYSKTEEQGEAAEWLEKAGDRAAAIYANETAIDNYQEVRRRLESQGAEAVVLARLDEKLGGVLTMAGRYDEAISVLEQSLEGYRQAHYLEAAGRVMAQIGLAHRHRGTAQEGLAQLQPMLEVLASSGPSPGLAALYISLNQLFFITGKYRESLAAAERASELARAIGNDRLLADAEQRRATSFNLLGEPEVGQQVLEGVLPLAEAVGDYNTLRLVLLNLGDAHRRMGEFDTAKGYTERSLEVTQRIGDPSLTSYALQNLAEVLIALGDWEEGELYLDQAAELLRSQGSSWYAAYPPLQRGGLRFCQGEWEQASHLLEEAVAIAGPGGDRQALEQAQSWLAEIDLLEGRPEAALARLNSLVSDEDADRPLLLPFLALVHLQLGAHDQAVEMAGEAVRLAREHRQRLLLVDALRVQGMVLLNQEQREEADRVFQEGLDVARSLPYPYAEARILEQMGKTEEALAIFRRLGAEKDSERIEAALATPEAT